MDFHTPLLAAIFDMDGTLVDNMRFHLEAWIALCRRFGVETTAERFEREFAGKKNEEILPQLLGRSLSAEEVARLSAEKESHYRALYTPHLALLRGAAELLSRLKSTGVRLAVATSSPTENRVLVLDGLGIRPLFEQIIGGEDVARGKPAPDIFLAAARGLGLEPSACVAFEDAVSGVRSARAAGMAVVGLTTTTSAELLREAGAHWTAPDFATLPADLQARLLPGPRGASSPRKA